MYTLVGCVKGNNSVTLIFVRNSNLVCILNNETLNEFVGSLSRCQYSFRFNLF